MPKPPEMKGFTIDEADAWWVACDACNDSELVFGSTADSDGITWATEHAKGHARSKT